MNRIVTALAQIGRRIINRGSHSVPPPSELRSNFGHLYADIFWYGLLAGSAVAFLAVYAARAGATTVQIGLLTAGPAVINLLFFQIVFFLGVIGAALSSYHLGRMRAAAVPPPRAGRPLGDLARPGILRFMDAGRSAAGLRFLTRGQGSARSAAPRRGAARAGRRPALALGLTRPARTGSPLFICL